MENVLNEFLAEHYQVVLVQLHVPLKKPTIVTFWIFSENPDVGGIQGVNYWFSFIGGHFPAILQIPKRAFLINNRPKPFFRVKCL